MESHIQHLQRASVDTSQTSYPSPVTISLKQELPSPHQSQKQASFISSAASALQRSDVQSLPKQDPPQRSVDMVQLLTVSMSGVLHPRMEHYKSIRAPGAFMFDL